jgi:DNA-binding transcriptional LysR family regulator
VRPADLAEENWLLPDFGPDSPSLKLIARMCAAAGFEPRVTFRVNDCNMTQAMVAAGEGISLHPRLSMHPLHAPVVVKVVEGEVPIRRVSAVRLPTRYLTPAAAEFLATLREAAERYTNSRR